MGATRMQLSRLRLSAIAITSTCGLMCALICALALPAPAAAQLLDQVAGKLLDQADVV